MAWNSAFSIANDYWQSSRSVTCWQRICTYDEPPALTSDDTSGQCDTSLSSKFWTVAEDRLLQKLAVKRRFNWEEIAQYFTGKTPNDIRLRWCNKLDPSIRNSEWSETEDTHLEFLVRHHGENWNAIALHMQGRTVPAIRKRCRLLGLTVSREAADMELEAPGQDKELEIAELQKRLEFLEHQASSAESELLHLQSQLHQDRP